MIPSPRAFLPAIPPAVGDVVMRALSDVEARFQDAAEMAVAIRAAMIAAAAHALDDVVPAELTIARVPALLGGRDPWAEAMPAPQVLPSVLVEEGRAIPVARLAAMHEGKRRKRAKAAEADHAVG